MTYASLSTILSLCIAVLQLPHPAGSQCDVVEETFPCFSGKLDCSMRMLSIVPMITNNTNSCIELQRNDIRRIENSDFKGLGHLRWLDLSENSISFIGDDSFSDLTGLTQLHLNNNNISTLKTVHFDALTELEVLFLQNNPHLLMDPCIFHRLQNLVALGLSGASVDLSEELIYQSDDCRRRFPDTVLDSNGRFRYVSNLSLLTIGYDNTVSDGKLLEHFESLTSIVLSSFPEDSLRGKYIFGLNNLTRLTLNSIAKFPKRFLFSNSLKKLFIDSATFPCLPAEGFADLTALEMVKISQSNLSWVDRRSFQGTRNINSINLSNNSLRYLPRDIFAGFENSTHILDIQLDLNPWHCDCRLAWLQEFLRDSSHQHTRQVTCQSPMNVTGIPILEVSFETCHTEEDDDDDESNVCDSDRPLDIVTQDVTEIPVVTVSTTPSVVTLIGIIVAVVGVLLLVFIIVLVKICITRSEKADNRQVNRDVTMSDNSDQNAHVYDNTPTVNELDTFHVTGTPTVNENESAHPYVDIAAPVDRSPHSANLPRRGRSVIYLNEAPKFPQESHRLKQVSKSLPR